MDNPETILQGALENHYQMIKEFRGWLLGLCRGISKKTSLVNL